MFLPNNSKHGTYTKLIYCGISVETLLNKLKLHFYGGIDFDLTPE